MSDSAVSVLAIESSLERDNQTACLAPMKAAKPRTFPVVLGIVIGAYLFCVLRVLGEMWSATGTLTFPLDDTYITMALAKNLALHGVMGISATRYVSASSCPGFLLLLAAAYRVTGPAVWWPLALSLTFGLLALPMAWRLLADTHWGIQIIALLAVIYFTPLHIMGILGMEHTLHLMLVLAFLHLAGNAIAEGKSPARGLLLLASFMVSVRYESLFMVAIACLLFALQRQIGAAVRLGIAAIVPVTLYSAVSILNGSYWLPQSIALKGFSASVASQAPAEWSRRFSGNLAQAPYLGYLACVILMLLVMPDIYANKRTRSMLAMVFGGIVLHISLASVGWVYRYEAYLVGAAIVVIGCGIPHVRMSRNWFATLAALAIAAAGVSSLMHRAAGADATLASRSEAVYSQQVQMARFLRAFEKGESVAANDIGAINYFADIECLDLTGLGDRDIFWLKRKRMYSTAAMAKLAAERGVKIAIVYDSWFRGGYLPLLPQSWIRVARWQTPYGVFLGGDTVSFYATSPGDAVKLKANLASFAPSLPPAVQVLDE